MILGNELHISFYCRALFVMSNMVPLDHVDHLAVLAVPPGLVLDTSKSSCHVVTICRDFLLTIFTLATLLADWNALRQDSSRSLPCLPGLYEEEGGGRVHLWVFG